MEGFGTILLVVIIALILGFAIYRLKKRDFTNNAKVIMQRLFSELQSINDKLRQNDISDQLKNDLTQRKNRVIETISRFYGRDLKTELR